MNRILLDAVVVPDEGTLPWDYLVALAVVVLLLVGVVLALRAASRRRRAGREQTGPETAQTPEPENRSQ